MPPHKVSLHALVFQLRLAISTTLFKKSLAYLIQTDRYHGLVVTALACGIEGPRIEITLNQVSGKLSLFTKQQMDIRLSSELGKVRLQRERRWAPPFTC